MLVQLGPLEVIFDSEMLLTMNRYLLFLLLALLFLHCDNEGPYHMLEVTNGRGSGVYELGRTVAITADPPPAEQAFFAWIGDTAHVFEPMAPVTTLKMPLEDVEVEATYKALPRYELTVVSGSGSGEYLENTRVLIEADVMEGYLFERWIGDTTFLEAVDTTPTYVTMPARSVSVEPTYVEAIDYVSFNETVLPIFIAKCSYSGCHDQNDPDLILTTYDEIKSEIGPVEESILSGTMPKTGELTPDEKDAVLTWIEQGALNN